MKNCYAQVQGMDETHYALGLYKLIPTGEPNTVRQRVRWVRLDVSFPDAADWVRHLTGQELKPVGQGHCVFAEVVLPLAP